VKGNVRVDFHFSGLSTTREFSTVLNVLVPLFLDSLRKRGFAPFFAVLFSGIVLSFRARAPFSEVPATLVREQKQ
jgi:hypothetical protein